MGYYSRVAIAISTPTVSLFPKEDNKKIKDFIVSYIDNDDEHALNLAKSLLEGASFNEEQKNLYITYNFLDAILLDSTFIGNPEKLSPLKNKNLIFYNLKEECSLDDDYPHTHPSYVKYLIETIKWYSFYENSIFSKIENLLKELDTDLYGFIKIGEDLEDITLEGSPYEFGLYINRTIDFN